MNKFKVGDLVRGVKSSYVHRGTLGLVIDMPENNDDIVTIDVLEHSVGCEAIVETKDFEFVESTETATPKIILSPDNAEDIDWLTYKSSQIIVRLSEKSGMPIERLTSLIVIGAEKFVEIENGTGKGQKA